MGCTSSKQSVCRNCHAQCSPVRMSYSSLRHRSPPREEGNHHLVELNSTTLGHLLLDPSTKPNQVHQDPAVAWTHHEPVRRNVPEKNSKDFAVRVIEAKTWSKMIDEKITKIIPKTPILTPPGEPETINAWELMEGLDDSSPKQPSSTVKQTCSIPLNQPSSPSNPNSNDITASSSDPNRISIKPLINEELESAGYDDDHAKNLLQNREDEILSRSKQKLILYFTSLRGVRKTYEDCCHVRTILKNAGARVDERDVSMHSGFKDELKELLGDGYNGGGLPKVFVGNKYIGGADEICRFHDKCQLDKVLEGCEMVDDDDGDGGGGGSGGKGCEACGNIRFLPCKTCSGSCKIYYDVDEDEVKENCCGFQRCPDCNENGLIRCPICCD